MSLTQDNMDHNGGAGEHENSDTGTRRLRRACNLCHQMKLRCTGTNPCARCQDTGCECVYALAAKLGKPKGARNKKTLQRLQNKEQATTETASPERTAPSPPNSQINSPTCFEPETDITVVDWDSLLSGPMTNSDTDTLFRFDEPDSAISMSEVDPMVGWHTPGNNIFKSSSDSLSPPLTRKDTSEAWFQQMGTGADDPMSIFELSEESKQHEHHASACNCLRLQFESICHLKSMEKEQLILRSDTDFATTFNALATSLNLLNCTRCQSDRETIEIIIMAVGLVFRRLQSLTDADLLGTDMRLKLGDQYISGSEPLSLVRKTLLTLARDKVQEAYARTRARVGKLVASVESGAVASSHGDVEQMDAMKLQIALMRLDVIFQRLQSTLQ
ncbi:hypothetical protein BJ170DRAFT_307253 [Xylariales sp. AK1849]|nr:hypothetical protein BJ170DRAFT_307253 [Xylariales sp. AK1849]